MPQVHAVTTFQVPFLLTVFGGEHRIKGVAGCANPIALPTEMGIVHISLDEPRLGGLPVDAQVDAVLILYVAALTETIGVEGCVALVEIAVNGGQPDLRV